MSVENGEQASKMPSMRGEIMSKMAEGDSPTKSCPMSEMFKRASGKRGIGLLVLIPGLLFVLVGVAIVLEPQILVWLLAGASIAVGIALLAIASFFRKLAADVRT